MTGDRHVSPDPTGPQGSAGPLEQLAAMPPMQPAPMPVQAISFWTPRTICAALARRLLGLFRRHR